MKYRIQLKWRQIKLSEEQQIFLGLGSNMGDRYQYLKKGIHQLNDHPHIWVIDQSYIYQSPAMYKTDQDDFYNMVAEIDTNLIPIDLLTEVKKIEIKTGRIPQSKKNIHRILDIDILAIGDLTIQSASLEIPHPGISERKFVLKPWSDIAPKFTLPDSSQTVSELLENTADLSEVRMVLILDKEGKN